MRYYNCYISTMQEAVLVRNTNTACFAGLKQYFYIERKDQETIYISNFKEKETEIYVDLIVEVMNKITPCEVVKIEDVEYIKFKLLDGYDRSLVLLNFIRNLWYGIGDYYAKNKSQYNIKFFEVLKTSKKYKEPLKRLTYANIEACKYVNVRSMGHSNTHVYSTLKIKNTKQLLKDDVKSTSEFLNKE